MALPGLEDLRAALRGAPVLLPGDQGFDSALDVWACAPPFTAAPRPAAVAQPGGTADVAAAVQWATQRGVPLAVKCGGHGGARWAPGALLLDLGRMRSVYVDPGARVAVVDGGARARDVDAETALHGLAAPLGVCSAVGVGGLALHGGLSLLSRAVGAVCDNILEATLVTADGAVHVVSPGSDPELFWALRGAGSTLGVVTKLKLRLHPTADYYSGTLVYADDQAHAAYKGILRWMREAVFSDPTIGLNIARALHPEHGPVVVCMVVVTGPEPAEAKAAKLQALRDLGPAHDTVGSATWLDTQRTHEPAIQERKAQLPVQYEEWVGPHFDAEQITDAFIDDWVAATTDALPPECAITLAFFELMGGQLKASDGPVGMLGDVQCVVQVGWADPGAHAVGSAYAARLREVLARHSPPAPTSFYVNMDMPCVTHLGYAEAAVRVRGAANLQRLAAVKARVDPTGVFAATPLAPVLAAADAEQ